MVRRVYVEKKPALRQEAAGLLTELRAVLGVTALEGLRLINRYDVEGLEESVFQRAVRTVFSEPQVDDAFDALPRWEGAVLAVEWSENIQEALPRPHITVEIAIGAGDRRTITITGDERFL